MVSTFDSHTLRCLPCLETTVSQVFNSESLPCTVLRPGYYIRQGSVVQNRLNFLGGRGGARGGERGGARGKLRGKGRRKGRGEGRGKGLGEGQGEVRGARGGTRG